VIAATDSLISRLWMRAVVSRRSVILCYHGVGPSNIRIDPGFLRIRPKAFQAQVDLLYGAGFEFITVAEFAELAAGGTPPPGLVALTFDDGMDDNHAFVMPMLRRYGIRATVYVATGLIGRPNPWMATDSGARMMTLDELRELVAADFEIGAHTVSHPDLSQLDLETCLHEVGDSRRVLEEQLGVPVRTFAYPFCRYDRKAIAAVRTAGFIAAVTCEGRGSWSRYELPRTIITGKDGLPSFLLKVASLHEPIYSSAPVRLVRSGTRGFRERRRERRDRPGSD
jgi:peptidoglycan/xylan/chitin deacetylase (PgdA/CDA1 family)